MKIITQTSDELVLKDGSLIGIIAGVIFAIVGVWFGYGIYSTSGFTAVLLISPLFIVIGILVFIFSPSITVDIKKAENQIIYHKDSLIRKSVSNFAISDVLRVETRKEWRTESNSTTNRNKGFSISTPKQVLVAQSMIIFKDGRQLPLDKQSSSSVSVGSVSMSGQAGEVPIANRVATFLNVPFQEISPPGGGGIGLNIGGFQI